MRMALSREIEFSSRSEAEVVCNQAWALWSWQSPEFAKWPCIIYQGGGCEMDALTIGGIFQTARGPEYGQDLFPDRRALFAVMTWRAGGHGQNA